jgi:PKD repeat protein
MKKILPLIALFLFIISCEKKVIDKDPLFQNAELEEGTIQFTSDAANATSWEWNFGDGNTSSEKDPKHQYQKNGTYTVVLLAKNKKSSVTKVYQVTVNNAPKPKPSFAFKSNGNGQIAFTNNTTGADSYLWNFGNGESSSEQNPTYSFTKNGTYEVKLSATNFNGTSEAKQNVTIADAPRPVSDFNFSYGSNGTVRFTNLSTNYTSLSWSFGNGQTSDQQNPTLQYGQNGNYNVVLTAKNDNGESTVTKSVNVTNISNTGSLVFWKSFSDYNVKVYINGNYVGLISGASNSAPSCSSQGFVTVSYPEGAYSYTAEEDTFFFPSKWSGTVNITKGACRTWRLTRN